MKNIACLLLLAPLLFAGVDARAEDDDGFKTASEIRISLPEGEGHTVAVSPGNAMIVVELPKGSLFPMDFTESSGGLLRDAEVESVGKDRVVLRLYPALGLLDRVIYEPGAVVLLFQSRFAVQNRSLGETKDQYELGPDDLISVTVHGHPDLNADLTINRQGYITAPLVGDVEAAGMTPRELAARLAELLGRDYLVDPQVDVDVEDFVSQWVMAAGEIRIPGRIPLKGGTRLKEILSEAGGFGDDAGEEITITRKVESSEEFVSIKIDRGSFESGESNPILSHGDIVTVSRAEYAWINGEVGSPGRVRIERGLTLLKAISESGGLTDWANRKRIQILAGEGKKPHVFNIKDIQSGRIADPELQGGEIIVVKRRFF